MWSSFLPRNRWSKENTWAIGPDGGKIRRGYIFTLFNAIIWLSLWLTWQNKWKLSKIYRRTRSHLKKNLLSSENSNIGFLATKYRLNEMASFRSRQSKYFAKRLWWIFYLVGSFFTIWNVYGNYRKYNSYGSVINERHIESKRKVFPKITLCPNSMHSRNKVAQRYRQGWTCGYTTE